MSRPLQTYPTAPAACSTIPAELRERDQWVAWRFEQRDGKWTKVPCDVRTGRRASTTDPDTWAPFSEALRALERGGHEGLGFVFAADDPYCGVDLDHCRDPETGEIASWAREIVRELDGGYVEVSPSGTGLHAFVRARLPGGTGRRKPYQGGAVEMYDMGRYFTITGVPVGDRPAVIADRQAAIERWHARLYPEHARAVARRTSRAPNDLDDRRLLELAERARNGERFRSLWAGGTAAHGSDHSAADLALCNHLAFWTGGDAARMDRLFRLSGLMRPKWDERRGQMTYGERTVAVAMAGREHCFGDAVPIRLDRRPKAVRIDVSKRPAAVRIDVSERPEAVRLDLGLPPRAVPLAEAVA